MFAYTCLDIRRDVSEAQSILMKQKDLPSRKSTLN